MQLLPLLDRVEATKACKPFIGYSDLTAVLSFLTLQCGVVSFHGPMLAGRLGRGEQGYDRSTFERALLRKTAMGEITAPSVDSIVSGEAAGMLIGGTLTQIVASLGTPFAFDPPAGHVLFLDEVGERPYRIDRMITQLRRADSSRAAAVVLNGCRNAKSRRASRRREGLSPISSRDFQARSCSDFPRATRPAL